MKTANWGWQQFAKRDVVFQHSTVQQSDNFIIVCTLQAQSQPPAGYWLGLGITPNAPYVAANTVMTGRSVGSGGGLSAWAGGAGASGGVAGGTTAGGGVKRVVPRGLVSAVGSLLDDQRENVATNVADASIFRCRIHHSTPASTETRSRRYERSRSRTFP